ncbi:MAG: DUF432 domain-containing protein, partial [Spirochaetaceae bacterium]|nr:DUF432 domain-containing protein [Spirochaetaceae bacterium]
VELLSAIILPDEENEKDPVFDITILDGEGPTSVIPMLPDKPLVLQPDTELRILPGARVQAHIPIPLGIGVTYGLGDDMQLIREFPAVHLSKTWFGEPFDGEAAYAWKTTFSDGLGPRLPDERIAYCPLVIRNESPEVLGFQRLILRVPFLSLYAVRAHIYTNRVTVRFRGQSQISQVSIGKGPKKGEDSALRISGPRTKSDRALLRRSFSFIKNLYTG